MKRLLLPYSIVMSVTLLGPVLSAQAAPAIIDRLEASVNASLILLSDIIKFRETMPLRAQLDPLFTGTAVAAQGPKASDKEIVEFLVDERLVAQEFKVSDTEVEQSINEIQSSNRIDRATLKRTLNEQGFSFDEYFELIRISAAKRNLIDRDIRSKVTISDDDVKNFYYNHYAKTSTEHFSYKVQIITISPENYKTPAAARVTAEQALKDIQKGESFEEVAKRISDDASASSGGELGTLTETQMAPTIRGPIKKLKIGEVSEVLPGPQGRWIILKLLDVTAGDQFNKLKEEIRAQLAAAEYQHQVSLWIERQRQTAFIHRAGQSSSSNILHP